MKTVGYKKQITVLFSSLSGIHSEDVTPDTTKEEVERRFNEYVEKKVEEYRKSFSVGTFDVDTYEVNEAGGMFQTDRKRHSMNVYDDVRKDLLENGDFEPLK